MGPVSGIGITTAAQLAAADAAAQRTANRNGSWRPDQGFSGDHGIRITLRKERGVTTGDVLRVPFRFPVPVMDDFSRGHTFNWSTYDTLRLGQRSRPDGKQLLILPLDTMFPSRAVQHAMTGVTVWDGVADPQGMLRELEWIAGIASGSQPQVFRLILDQPSMWGKDALVNMLATLTVVQPTQKTNEPGTEYVSLSFLEFNEDVANRKQRSRASGPLTYTLRSGDTLYEIAKKSPFHAASAWRTIAKANGITGVSPGSASELAAWAKKHHKTAIVIPSLAMNALSGSAVVRGSL